MPWRLVTAGAIGIKSNPFTTDGAVDSRAQSIVDAELSWRWNELNSWRLSNRSKKGCKSQQLWWEASIQVAWKIAMTTALAMTTTISIVVVVVTAAAMATTVTTSYRQRLSPLATHQTFLPR